VKSKTFQDGEVWRKSHAWVLKIYTFSAGFPIDELFGITSQLRRAAVSVPANFAEGFKKLGLADKVRFCNIAQGSLEECRYYLILAKDLGYGDTCDLMNALDEVGSMLEGYARAITSEPIESTQLTTDY
jgi:four helix bundle protein